jgi:pimeloyl-ACP methyl ester carboxylesterase
VDGQVVEVMEAGEGDPLLFLHGWGLTPRSYASAVTGLCGAGVRILAPSLPGFGRSSPLRLRARIGEYAERVAGLVDAVDPEKPCFVVGHSFGGGVALRLGHDRPDLVRSLTLINAVGGAGPHAAWSPHSWQRWARGAMTELHPRNWLSSPATADLLADLLPTVLRRPLHLASSAFVALTADLAEQAQAVVDAGVPIVFVWGDRDRLIGPGRLAGVSLPLGPDVVVGGHGWMLTEPAEFAAAVRDALVVHALMERLRRGQATPGPAASLAEALPAERRRRARHTPMPGVH